VTGSTDALSPTSIKELEERWREWLETINQDITTIFFWRATWLAVGDMVRANAQIRPSHYFAYLSNTYGTSQALAVRRLTDDHHGVVSLATLIKDLRTHASEITADWWLGLQPNADIRDFARFRADGTDHFDPRIAREDLRRLRREVAHVKKYVDKHLAHRDQDPTKEIPTFADIHAALDAVAAVFRKYYMLLTGADRFVMVPVPHPGWFRPFTVPWLPPESPSPRLRGTIGSDPL
jgi:hypothetical protein